MMKKMAVLCLIVLATAASAGATTLITFDDSPVGPLSAGTVLTNQYQALGVVFKGFEDGAEVPSVVDTYWGTSPAGGNYWTNDDPAHSLGNVRRDMIEVRFLGVANNVSFDYVASWGPLSITVDLYDTSDVLIGSQNVVANWHPLDLSSYSNIAYIQLLQPDDSWVFAVDNLRFDLAGGATVPAPAALALGTLGMGLVGWLRRRSAL